MAISYLFGTAAFAVLAAASTPPWAGPAPTPIQADGIRADFLAAMPEPTSPAELKARAAPPPDYLCGYVTGDIENSVYCSAIRTCVFNSVYSAQACCIQNTALSGTQYTSCSFYTSCLPYALETGTVMDPHVTSCNSLYPVCFTYSYTDIGFVNYGCSTRAYSSAVQLTYSGETFDSSSASATIIRDTASTQAGESSTSSGSTSSTVSGGAPIQTTNSAASSSATATSGGSGKKKSNAGAIAGGVVGGVAVIALLIAAIVFILSRRSKSSKTQAAAVPPMQQQYVGGQPMGPGSPGVQQPMPQQNYYGQQPGQQMPYGQPGMQQDYTGGMQPGTAAPVYYGQDQKSMPGFGEQAAHTPQSPAGTYQPSSVSPQPTGMSEAPTDGARSSIAPQNSGTAAQPQAQPVYEIGENK